MKNLHTFRLAVLLMGTALGTALVAHAQTIIADRQDEVRLAKPAAEDEAVLQIRDDGTPQEAQQKVSLEYMAAEAMVVKGKQYSAETSTETVQTLSDGNRIVHRTVSKFYRDSEGRTRREETFGNVDPEHPTPHEVKVFINDPVSGTAYVLDPGSKSAEKVVRSKRILDEPNGDDDSSRMMFKFVKDTEDVGRGAGPVVVKLRDDHSGNPNVVVLQMTDDKREVVKEDLGSKAIEGVDCNGTRETMTIPAGALGNEKPISIVTETWYAPSISAVVQSTTDDPRYGKTTYQLSNVQTTEPARTLFDPPADFKIEARR
jgi:hypothetical protein